MSAGQTIKFVLFCLIIIIASFFIGKNCTGSHNSIITPKDTIQTIKITPVYIDSIQTKYKYYSYPVNVIDTVTLINEIHKIDTIRIELAKEKVKETFCTDSIFANTKDTLKACFELVNSYFSIEYKPALRQIKDSVMVITNNNTKAYRFAIGAGISLNANFNNTYGYGLSLGLYYNLYSFNLW